MRSYLDLAKSSSILFPPCAALQVDWDYFGFQFEPAFSKWPLMVAAGEG
jgi:hypothetical protein